jgi:putative two-component system response regulator
MLKKLLAVDDEPNNLQVLRQILRDRYQLIFAPNGEKALEAAAKHLPDLILLDIMMPEMNGYEVCRKLKANPATKAIPVIFVTAMNEVEDEARGFDVGAVDYIQKPVSAPIMLRRIETHLSLVRIQELEDSHRQAVFMLGEAGHYNDNDTGAHIWRMAAYARVLAAAAGWPDHLVARLELAAPMHDTGKIGTPDSILQAPRKLTADEWVIMREHTVIGYRILSNSSCKIFAMAAEIAHYHHEKWDGSGYPHGLSGEAIPESARIVALADVFDALTTKRPYKAAWSIEDSVAEIHRGAGSHFEPRLVALFENLVPELLRIRAEWSDDRSSTRTGLVTRQSETTELCEPVG